MSARRLAVLLPLALVLASGACRRRPAEAAADSTGALGLTAAQRARIHVITATDTVFQPTAEVTGTVAFNGDRSTQLLSPISGTVTAILVDLGTHVHKGQPLAEVASPDFAADIAAYRTAQAAWANAQRIATRDSALFANDAVARQELEQAQTDLASAAANRDAALASLRALGMDSATMADVITGRLNRPLQGMIRAPIEGHIVERLLTPGQLLQASTTPVFTIADVTTMWVMANVFEADLPNVTVGDAAQVRLTEGDRVIPGRVAFVGAVVDPDTRATQVRILCDNPGEVLKRDMYVRVSIFSGRPRHGIVVPSSAVLRDEQNLPFVFVATPQGGFTRRPVTLDGHVGNGYHITSGLAPGDRVVAEGALFLQFAESQ